MNGMTHLENASDLPRSEGSLRGLLSVGSRTRKATRVFGWGSVPLQVSGWYAPAGPCILDCSSVTAGGLGLLMPHQEVFNPLTTHLAVCSQKQAQSLDNMARKVWENAVIPEPRREVWGIKLGDVEEAECVSPLELHSIVLGSGVWLDPGRWWGRMSILLLTAGW